MKNSLRDNLLVTIGARAAHIESADYIELPSGSNGEDVLAKFASTLADTYMSLGSDVDVGFDEHIETALEKRFPKM